jgi:predicted transcriptional regulator
VSDRATLCITCHNKQLARTHSKIAWPEPEILLEELKYKSYTRIAKELGVSDNAIRKYLKRTVGQCPKKHIPL